jgi:hypothetical protein
MYPMRVKVSLRVVGLIPFYLCSVNTTYILAKMFFESVKEDGLNGVYN